MIETSEFIDLISSGRQGADAPKPSGAVPKYRITPQLLEELRLAYVGTRPEISASLKRVSARYKIPAHRLTMEARRQGWQTSARKPWTTKEDAFLLEGLGKISYGKMAAELKRGWSSVAARVRELQRLQAVQRAAGGFYLEEELARVFGVGLRSVRKWIACGFFGKSESIDGVDGISSAQVARFVREHIGEYSLARVDQCWFKALVFGSCDGEEKVQEGK